MANEHMYKFFEEYDKLKDKYPDLYLHIKEYSREPRRWRVHVLGKNLSPLGDTEFVFAEEKNREDAFKQAILRMQSLEAKIKELSRMQTYGKSLIAK